MITILSAVIGGVLLTVLAILFMILCRRSSALTLKAIGNNGEKQYQNGSNTGPGSTLTSGMKCLIFICCTGKSLSEALLFAEHGENILCTKVVLNFCTKFSCIKLVIQ